MNKTSTETNNISGPRYGLGKKVEWRRNKVQELLVKGYNQWDIAKTLQISQPTISRDIQHLRKAARDNLMNHFDEKLPEEYQRCLIGINEVLRKAWNIASADEEKHDERTRLQALQLVNDCYKYRMDLLTNSTLLTEAMKFLEQSKQKVQNVGNNNNNNSTSSIQGDQIKNDIQGSKEVNSTGTGRPTTRNQTF